jgi:hypothetical protein
MTTRAPTAGGFGMVKTHLLGIEKGVLDESHGSVDIGWDPLTANSASDSVELRITLAVIWVLLPVVVAAERERGSWVDTLIAIQAFEAFHMIRFVQRSDK